MTQGAAEPAILDFIRSQPAAVRAAARAAADLAPGGRGATAQELLAFGCGTSYHAAELALAAAHDRRAPRVRAAPAYEVWQFGPGAATATRVLAVSHSGETAATIEAVAAVRAQSRAEVVAVTCHAQSRLARSADRVVLVPAGDESVGPKTKGFAASAAAVVALTGRFAAARDDEEEEKGAERAAARMERVLQAPPAAFDQLVRLAAAARHIWVLGAGPLRPIAREGALKIVEMAGRPARAIEQEEFIHGWRRGTDPDHLVIALAPLGAGTPRLTQVVDMCTAQGARLAVIQAARAPVLAGADLTLDLPLEAESGAWAALAYVLPLQILAYALGTPGAAYWP